MTFIKLKYGNRRGEVQDFPYATAKELIDNGQADLVSVDPSDAQSQLSSKVRVAPVTDHAAPPAPLAAITSRKGRTR